MIQQFKNNLVENFEDTIWHLLLLEYLPKIDFQLENPGPGSPDIKAKKDGQTYWIEAVNSNLGEHVENPTFNVNGVAVEFAQRHDPRVTTRLSNSILTKSKKFKTYNLGTDDIKTIAGSAHIDGVIYCPYDLLTYTKNVEIVEWHMRS